MSPKSGLLCFECSWNWHPELDEYIFALPELIQLDPLIDAMKEANERELNERK